MNAVINFRDFEGTTADAGDNPKFPPPFEFKWLAINLEKLSGDDGNNETDLKQTILIVLGRWIFNVRFLTMLL